ncbi:toll/interleukin-1 receptor domain-containing protein [Dehalococcoidales bacterium]|nr:toll/interleukin-1 receptor domain-containing protein [Dehalococcoidales bacterium]
MSIFLSYCEEDASLVHRIFYILSRLRLDPYAFKLFPEPGAFIHEIVLSRIKDSEYVIPFITQNGVQSQWVNQEIGAAHALRKYIIPVVEVGVESKGFVDLRLRHAVQYQPIDPNQMIYSLIWRLCTLLKPKYLDAECPKCENTFIMKMPSFELWGDVISKGDQLQTECPCGNTVILDPLTLEVIP